MSRRNKITLICTLAAIAVLGLTWTRAQMPPGLDYGGEYMGSGDTWEMIHGGGGPGGSRMPYTPMGYGMGVPAVEPPAARELNARLAPVLQRWRDAADDQQKEAIKDQLSSILEDYFERDLQRRSSEIDTIEQRVQRLREQLEQRQQAKDEILQLQLKVLENEAAGLGFFGRRPPAPGGGGMMGMVGPGDMGDMGDMGMGMDMGMSMGPGMAMEAGMAMGPSMGGMFGGIPVTPVPAKFQKRVSVDFVETSFDQALDYLRELTGANIYVDQHALKDAGIDLDASVSIRLDDVSVATVLELIAESLSASLGVRYEDGIAVLGTRSSPSLSQRVPWGNDGTPPSQQTGKRLADSVRDYVFIEEPISQALDVISDAAQVDVFVNERTLDAAGVTMDAPVTINLRGVRHRTALRLILDSVDKSLIFSVVDGVVVVSALEQSGG